MTTIDRILGVSRCARERMAEIHGRDLTAPEWLAVVDQIVSRRAVLVRSDAKRDADIYATQALGTTIMVVWRPSAAVIVTVLPETVSRQRPSKILKAETLLPRWQNGKKLTPKTRWHKPRSAFPTPSEQDETGGDE